MHFSDSKKPPVRHGIVTGVFDTFVTTAVTKGMKVSLEPSVMPAKGTNVFVVLVSGIGKPIELLISLGSKTQELKSLEFERMM